MSNWLLHTIIVGPRRVDRGNERYRGVYGWGQRRVMGLVGQALWPEYRFRRTASARKIFTRTLTARIHSAFSSVRNALHSLRIAGFVQGPLPYEQDTPTADHMMTRATESVLWMCMAEREGTQKLERFPDYLSLTTRHSGECG